MTEAAKPQAPHFFFWMPSLGMASLKPSGRPGLSFPLEGGAGRVIKVTYYKVTTTLKLQLENGCPEIGQKCVLGSLTKRLKISGAKVQKKMP